MSQLNFAYKIYNFYILIYLNHKYLNTYQLKFLIKLIYELKCILQIVADKINCRLFKRLQRKDVTKKKTILQNEYYL